MKQKIIEFILENLDDGYGGIPPAEEWAENVLDSNQSTYTFRSKYVKKGKKSVLHLDGKVEAFRVREGWPYGLVARRFEPDQIPEGFYLTEEEARIAYRERQIVTANSRKLIQSKADETFRAIEEDYGQFLQSLHCKYGAELYPDASASDDTGLETYMAVDFTVKGEDGIPHGFSYKLKD